jgi:hypothetical protein
MHNNTIVEKLKYMSNNIQYFLYNTVVHDEEQLVCFWNIKTDLNNIITT